MWYPSLPVVVSLEEWLQCPGCGGAIASAPAQAALHCPSCRLEFPRLGKIPALFAEPQGVLRSWAKRLGAFHAEIEQSIKQLLVELVEENLTERARRRLDLVAKTLPRHREAIDQLFEEVGIEPAPVPRSSGLSGGEPSLLSYYALIHRDFGWGPEADEVTPSIERTLEVLPQGFELGNTLVLGAGTARYVWELGRRLGEQGLIVALDNNPLPFLVTQRLLEEKSVTLFEFPAHPRRSTMASVERQLTAPGKPPQGLRLLFADALRPPVKPGVFDTVVTPWFVDQVPHDAADIPREVSRLLRPGGSWINTGPFIYDPTQTKPAHRYCADEFLELVRRSGFSVTHAQYESMAYMASPVSTQGRTEHVLFMHARKDGVVPDVVEEPDWLRPESKGELTVPSFEGLEDYVGPQQIVSDVAALIDGRRSTVEIARELICREKLANDGTAEAVVRGCLKIIYRQLRKNFS